MKVQIFGGFNVDELMDIQRIDLQPEVNLMFLNCLQNTCTILCICASFFRPTLACFVLLLIRTSAYPYTLTMSWKCTRVKKDTKFHLTFMPLLTLHTEACFKVNVQ